MVEEHNRGKGKGKPVIKDLNANHHLIEWNILLFTAYNCLPRDTPARVTCQFRLGLRSNMALFQCYGKNQPIEVHRKVRSRKLASIPKLSRDQNIDRVQ